MRTDAVISVAARIHCTKDSLKSPQGFELMQQMTRAAVRPRFLCPQNSPAFFFDGSRSGLALTSSFSRAAPGPWGGICPVVRLACSSAYFISPIFLSGVRLSPAIGRPPVQEETTGRPWGFHGRPRARHAFASLGHTTKRPKQNAEIAEKRHADAESYGGVSLTVATKFPPLSA